MILLKALQHKVSDCIICLGTLKYYPEIIEYSIYIWPEISSESGSNTFSLTFVQTDG